MGLGVVWRSALGCGFVVGCVVWISVGDQRWAVKICRWFGLWRSALGCGDQRYAGLDRRWVIGVWVIGVRLWRLALRGFGSALDDRCLGDRSWAMEI